MHQYHTTYTLAHKHHIYIHMHTVSGRYSQVNRKANISTTANGPKLYAPIYIDMYIHNICNKRYI